MILHRFLSHIKSVELCTSMPVIIASAICNSNAAMATLPDQHHHQY